MQAEATMLEGLTPAAPIITADTTPPIITTTLAITAVTTLEATRTDAARFMVGALVIVAAGLSSRAGEAMLAAGGTLREVSQAAGGTPEDAWVAASDAGKQPTCAAAESCGGSPSNPSEIRSKEQGFGSGKLFLD